MKDYDDDVHVFLCYGILFYYTSAEYIWVSLTFKNPNRIFLLKCFVSIWGFSQVLFGQHHILHGALPPIAQQILVMSE